MEGGLPPDYVLYQMQPFEIEIALSGLHLKHKELWEATRLLMYAIVQVNSKQKLDPKDVLSLPWDNEAIEMCSERDPYKEMQEEMYKILKDMNDAR